MSRKMGISYPLGRFVFAFDLQDCLLREIGDFFSLCNPQGFTLSGAPAFQTFSDFSLIPLAGRGVEIGAQQRPRQVLLRQEMVGRLLRVFIPFGMTQST